MEAAKPVLDSRSRSAFEEFLSQYSEIIFLYTSIPTFLQTFIGLLTGILLFVHKSDYYNCKSSSDPLFALLLGHLLFYYSFFILYSNLLFQLVPFLTSLSFTFASFLTYFTLSLIFNLWGISALSSTSCSDSVYSGIAGFNITFNLLFILLLIISFTILLIKKRKPSETKPAPQVLSQEKLVEQPSALDDQIVQESGWKEENLDGF